MGFRLIPGAAERLLAEHSAREHVKAVTERAAEIARTETTPIRSGEHRKAIITEYEENLDGTLTGKVGSTSSTWHLIEFGSIHNPAFRSITKAIEKAGAEFDPS